LIKPCTYAKLHQADKIHTSAAKSPKSVTIFPSQNTVDTIELELLDKADANSRADSARAEATSLRACAERAEVELIVSRAERSELLDHLEQVEGRLMVNPSPRASFSVSADVDGSHLSRSDLTNAGSAAIKRQPRNVMPRVPSALGMGMGIACISRRQVTGSTFSSQLLTDKGSSCGSVADGSASVLKFYSIYEQRLLNVSWQIPLPFRVATVQPQVSVFEVCTVYPLQLKVPSSSKYWASLSFKLCK
jgi:hypothetical protein